ncbi:GntP family permease [Porphyromonadaceae bacterium]
MFILTILAVSIVAMVIAISRYRVHPFWAMMITALFLAFAVGIPFEEVVKVIENGFSSTLASIGLVIILGAMIGAILESTGAALKLADMLVKRLGESRPHLSMLLIGAVVSIPVFCDSGFILINPIRKALAAKTKSSAVGMTLALAGGLFASHVFIPPTPGPTAATEMLGMGSNMIWIILLGGVATLFALIPAYFYAQYIGKRVLPADTLSESELRADYETLLSSYGRLPNGFLSLLPILLPIVLMSVASVVKSIGSEGMVVNILLFVGKPVISLAFGLLSALLLKRGVAQSKSLYEITNQTLHTVGPILFITAAGASLGKVIAASNFVTYLESEASVLMSLGIVFPFLLSAMLKSAQGSSTVAMTTTASLLGAYSQADSLLFSMGLNTPYLAALTVLSIGAGSMTVSHANDSYFWVVTGFGEIRPEDGYRTQTMMTLLMGLGALAGLLIMSFISLN